MSVLAESRIDVNTPPIGNHYQPDFFNSVEVPPEISEFLATVDQGELSAFEPGCDYDPVQGLIPYKQLREQWDRQLRSVRDGSWLANKPARIRYMWLNEGWAKNPDPSYLEYIGCEGEALTNEDKYLISLNEIKKTGSCGKSFMSMLGRESRDLHYGRVHCEKQYCSICGGKGGRVHKRRKNSVYKSVSQVLGVGSFDQMMVGLKDLFVRQLVFTVPEKYRDQFQSRRGVEQLVQGAKKVVEEFFGAPVLDNNGNPKKKSGQVVYSLAEAGKQACSYLHVFSEENPGVFHPHVNVHIFERKGVGENYKLTPEVLDAIRARWLRSLKYMGCKGIEVVDVQYSFRITPLRIMHAINYMTRPLNREFYDLWVEQGLKELVTFMVYEMKGYTFLRKWGNMANAAVKDCADVKAEMEERTGEKMDFVGFVSEKDIQSMIKSGMLEDLGGGFYRRKSKSRASG